MNKTRSVTESVLQSISEQDPNFYRKLVTLEKQYNLNSLIPNKYSFSFLMDLHYRQERHGHIDSIIKEISLLETEPFDSITKAATQFRRKPLVGLWHKHYYDGSLSFLAQNVSNGMKKYGIPYFDKRVEESKIKGIIEYIKPEDIPHIVNDIVNSNMLKRRAEHQMTGEWIIFSRVSNVNFYLCLAKHDDGDEMIGHKLEPIRKLYPHFFECAFT